MISRPLKGGVAEGHRMTIVPAAVHFGTQSTVPVLSEDHQGAELGGPIEGQADVVVEGLQRTCPWL